jgi:O-antigen/teichoic acid export membrane protein
MTTKRLILQNSLLNFAASVSQRIGQTVIFILVARLLTADSTGAFKLATTYTSILLTVSLWGLDQLLIREVAKDKTAAGRYLSGFLLLRLALALAAWLSLALLMPLLPYNPESKQLILIMAASIIPSNITNLYQSIWTAFENVKAISVILLVVSVIRVLVGAAVLWHFQTLAPVAYLFLALSVVELAAHAWLTHWRGRLSGIRWQIDLPFWLEQCRIAIPLIIVTFILVVEYQFDDVILSFFRPQDEVGVYGTAATVLALLLFLTRSYQLAVFPLISRTYHANPAALPNVYIKTMLYIILAALPVSLFVSLLAGPIIRLIFGEGYEAAGPILSIMVWAFFLSAVNVANSRLLIVADRQRVMAYFALMSMSGNILLSLLLVPRLGGIGTAWARVLAMPLYTIPALLYVQRYLCPVPWQAWWRVKLFRQSS